MAELKNISPRHDQIMDWLLANPHLPLSTCAAEFGLTQSWLSSIIHSDLFQAKLRERQEEIFGEVALTVKDRITSLAHESLKRMTDKVMVEQDLDKIANASEIALKALGFGQQRQTGGPQVQVNVTAVNKDVLAEARARMERKAIEVSDDRPSPVPLSITNSEGIVE